MKTLTTALILFVLTITIYGCGKADRITGPDVSTQPQVEQVEQTEAGAGVLQVAIFSAFKNETGLQNLINVWLSQNNNNLEVVQILQTQSGDSAYRSTTISIFYKKTK